ncbi:MAG TPA: hypothetical protein PKK12_03360 [Candidatus Aminicenantes bacterium]|nr:hypothetical protein [Candidatus Aminicenantes bacterium]
MDSFPQETRDLIAQWAFDARPILGRFHLWLENVEVTWVRGEPAREFTADISFMEGGMERLFAVTGAVTALGTRLFGRYGAGKGLDKAGLNQAKKAADAISAYAMSESLWYLSRQLPENHAIMVCVGEGLMPKAGETPEMGSNPQLGFGRVYARPSVARWLDRKVVRLLNHKNGYGWEEFYRDIKTAGITIWGAAIDTLENTSRFSKGAETGPMTVLHLFDQPLAITRPYEGYMGNLFLPREVAERAAAESILLSFRTPRAQVMRAIRTTYPDIPPERVHVWTLGGKSRVQRIGDLWREWTDLGAHVLEEGFALPTGLPAFTESGTYAPTFHIGPYEQDGVRHLFLCDGYAASAEAIQAASLAPMLGLVAFISPFTSTFEVPYDRERRIMNLDPDGEAFPARLAGILGREVDEATAGRFRDMIEDARGAGIPVHKMSVEAGDFFPEKKWDVLAVSGYMCPDPYSGAPGVEEVEPGLYRVTVRLASSRGDKRITFTLRLMETLAQSWLVFNPLLSRFMEGEDYQHRPVRISDSGRIRNELQTLCSEALEFPQQDHIRVHFERIPPEVIPPASQVKLLEILRWYKQHHPLWFSWLDIAAPEDNK